ncbi:hypothetical protein ALP75_200354 [Pseudomonas syringae pv. actinidiae]|nr:hypothetical protein ALP75_200354 [Pseudomonas syringae pv. actinidiae]
MSIRRIGQQVDDVVHVAYQTRHVRQCGYFDERRLGSRRGRHAIDLHTEWQQKLGNTLADITGTDDQYLAACQALTNATVPLALDLTHQARQHLALMTEHVGQNEFGHDLTENPYSTRQAIILRQTVGQQWRDPRPGRLQPLWLVPLAQEIGHQVRLPQPDRAVAGQPRQLGRVAGAQDLQVRRSLAQQLGVNEVIVLGNQNAHVSKTLKTGQATHGECGPLYNGATLTWGRCGAATLRANARCIHLQREASASDSPGCRGSSAPH